MFFKKSKKIIIDCYTNDASAYHNAPISKASAVIPKWFKDLEPSIGFDKTFMRFLQTVKVCSGLNKLFSKGFVIPLWTDLRIEVDEKGKDSYRWMFADGETNAVIHDAYQRGEWCSELEYASLKISSPWRIICSEPIDFVWIQPTYSQDKPEEILTIPAILNFYDQYAANLNILIPRADEQKMFEIKAFSPVAHVIPMSDRKLEIRTHLVTTEELNKINGKKNPASTFENSIAKIKKCPFH